MPACTGQLQWQESDPPDTAALFNLSRLLTHLIGRPASLNIHSAEVMGPYCPQCWWGCKDSAWLARLNSLPEIDTEERSSGASLFSADHALKVTFRLDLQPCSAQM